MGKLARLIVQPQDVLYDLLGIFQPKVGEYYLGSALRDWASTAVDVVANRLHASYYPIFRKCKFDRIAISVAGAGGTGAKIRLGIYDDKDFYPNSLLLDAGEVNATTTGYKEITIDQTLDVGVYWIVHNANDGTIDLHTHETGIPVSMKNVQQSYRRYRIDQTYGALPDPFPTGAAKVVRGFAVGLRVAEVF